MRSGTFEDQFVNIARGIIPGITHINKFGYNTSVGSTFEPITDLGTNVLPASAGVVSIVSSSANDDDGGTGANTVNIQGLDGDFLPVDETVTLNGTSAVTTTATFIRVFRMRVVSAGSALVNNGTVTASIGGSAVAAISADEGQTLMAVYTVPANKAAFMTNFHGSLSKNQEAQFEIRTKDYNDGWNVKGRFGTFSQAVEYTYKVPIRFNPKSDIQIRGKAGATSEMGAIFDLLLIDL